MSRKASVTEEVGAENQWEGFARTDYSLPDGHDEQGGCYNETCAGLGILMLADRLQLLGLNGASVTDLAERVLYNSSVTCGMSLDGVLFTYENRLASSPQEPCRRFPYFDCLCCPPNVLRTLAVISGYLWSPIDGMNTVAIHHFFSGTLRHEELQVEMRTEYPLDGKVTLSVRGTSIVKVRIPSWSSCRPNNYDARTQYATFGAGHHQFDLDVKSRLIFSHRLTYKRAIALAFGPLIYCLEDVNNAFEAMTPGQGHFKDLTIEKSILDALKCVNTVGPDGCPVVLLHAPGVGRRINLPSGCQTTFAELDPAVGNAPTLDERRLDLVFVPYYFRANRKEQSEGSQMRVWIQDRGCFAACHKPIRDFTNTEKKQEYSLSSVASVAQSAARHKPRCFIM